MNANRTRIRTTRKIHFKILFINRRFEVSCGFRSWKKSSSNSSLRLVRGNRPQPLKEKPNTDDQFEQRHRRIENVVVHDLVEVREDEVDKRAEHTPCGRDYAKDRQSSRDVVRLKPQPRTNGGGEAEKWQADIIGIEIRADV